MGAESRGGPAGTGWFAVAVQALVVLTRSDGVCPSQTIAGNLRAHAVFMRRVLAHLARAGLVEAREGRDGGYRLSRAADTITLADVYRAVKAVAPGVGAAEGDDACAGVAVLGSIHGAFAGITAEAQDAYMAVLERHTVGELARLPQTAGAFAQT